MLRRRTGRRTSFAVVHWICGPAANAVWKIATAAQTIQWLVKNFRILGMQDQTNSEQHRFKAKAHRIFSPAGALEPFHIDSACGQEITSLCRARVGERFQSLAPAPLTATRSLAFSMEVTAGTSRRSLGYVGSRVTPTRNAAAACGPMI